MILIRNATLVNEGRVQIGSVWIEGERIKNIIYGILPNVSKMIESIKIIEAFGCLLLPGMIDGHVHFREPGFVCKGNIFSESRAAVSGGITSFIDMPNTSPQTITIEALNDKFSRAQKGSWGNYSFFIGATNNNFKELVRPEANRAVAIKVFMGSSTKNLWVDKLEILEQIFSLPDRIIAVHCEDEDMIQANQKKYVQQFGNQMKTHFHPKIRSEEACFISSKKAIKLSKKHHTRLHILHVSTAREVDLLEAKPLKEKQITAEACVHHLWFSNADYARLGNRIKWNPSVKTMRDRDALRQAIVVGKIDVVATDHSPHTLEEKQGGLLQAAAGAPMVQHALLIMLELCRQHVFSFPLVVEKIAHAPAQLFGLKDRGFIRPGYYADLVLIDPNRTWKVTTNNLWYKCGWSPLEGTSFSHQILKTFVNGHLVYDKGKFISFSSGKELEF